MPDKKSWEMICKAILLNIHFSFRILSNLKSYLSKAVAVPGAKVVLGAKTVWIQGINRLQGKGLTRHLRGLTRLF